MTEGEAGSNQFDRFNAACQELQDSFFEIIGDAPPARMAFSALLGQLTSTLQLFANARLSQTAPNTIETEVKQLE